MFGKSIHQKEYVILRKGLDSGLSKEQLTNLFNNQDSIKSPVQVIDEYISNGGLVKGGIKAEFHYGCNLIPDPRMSKEEDINDMMFCDMI